MKIQYCSDLHLEFPENLSYIQDNPIEPKAEVLILAGDIVPLKDIENYTDFFDDISAKFKKVYWIIGNHELYFSDLKGSVGAFQKKIRDNVTLLNNTVVEIEGVNFIFTTLWSRIKDENAFIISRWLNDFRLISDGEGKLTTKKYNELFEENFDFIKASITNSTKKCVVITHHVPTLKNYPPEYAGSEINNAFATDLDEFIEQSGIDFWIYGHHHRNVRKTKIGKTTLLTNQLGYIRSNEQKGFDSSQTFEV